jgi:hypothetical protein
VAQAFELAGAKNIVSAPPFAHFAKGGNVERMRDRVAEPQERCRQHRYPPLQKTQGRGTLSTLIAHTDIIKGWATRPLGGNLGTDGKFPSYRKLGDVPSVPSPVFRNRRPRQKLTRDVSDWRLSWCPPGVGGLEPRAGQHLKRQLFAGSS